MRSHAIEHVTWPHGGLFPGPYHDGELRQRVTLNEWGITFFHRERWYGRGYLVTVSDYSTWGNGGICRPEWRFRWEAYVVRPHRHPEAGCSGIWALRDDRGARSWGQAWSRAALAVRLHRMGLADPKLVEFSLETGEPRRWRQWYSERYIPRNEDDWAIKNKIIHHESAAPL